MTIKTPLLNSISLWASKKNTAISEDKKEHKIPEILFITSFPARECGIATYSEDLIAALNNKFESSFNIKVAALESINDSYSYGDAVDQILKTDSADSYQKLSEYCNSDEGTKLLLIQHEFGLFKNNETDLIKFLSASIKPVLIVLHTVLPLPNQEMKRNIIEMDTFIDGFIVMTQRSAALLQNVYGIDREKISVIAHGTHLVKHGDKEILKEKYGLAGKKVISTFGLLSSGKSIETTLDALPVITSQNPSILFLIIGKTHPSVVKEEGEKYRDFLKKRVEILGLQENVKFINVYLPLEELLEYLQLTDIYLFTSNDPHQAVSGTFSYAISCGCPIISTPIPHALEVLQDGTGVIIEFGDTIQLAEEVLRLLKNLQFRKAISANGIHKMAPTAWENSAIAHAGLFKKIIAEKIDLHYKIPEINLSHFKNLTTSFAMIQFSVINHPDISTGYTLDDNARALVAICQHYELKREPEDLELIEKYYSFIKFCLQENGSFLNYVNIDQEFTKQNSENLEDSNGRAIWSLGFMLSLSSIFPVGFTADAAKTMKRALRKVHTIYSTRAMAFVIKGVYYRNKNAVDFENIALIKLLSNRLVKMYRHECKSNWKWFESYLTYGNSILPEALLCAYLATGEYQYKEIAKESFDFLLSHIFTDNKIKVISNKGWLDSNRHKKETVGGEQPIDVAYTILALERFNGVFKNSSYLEKMETAFSWFLGNNHLHKIIYNPCTGGCYDGMEENYINLNQGAESTVSYLMARLTMEKYTAKKELLHKNTSKIKLSENITALNI
ncbi:glycosyltransferase [Flavobacterium cheongpyeongense]|uniref:glycosyltransferase n=1 Tax=Flavobacterium cheongpyeongense TaxID=2212651 RepID=UPI001E4E377F|nr:glycosyltransferase [Flavobacterium cheongpyeongense]